MFRRCLAEEAMFSRGGDVLAEEAMFSRGGDV